ncbi:MAG: TonB-dependent receptor [Rhodospirillales bacterium]|nr:TonB-dependent receptor [Rhodospirillales bacterium]
MRRMVLAAFVLATPLLPAGARADGNSTTTPTASPAPGQPAQQTVVTATRVATPEDDIPAGVTVITRATIEARGYQTLTDALAAVPGLRVAQSGGPGGNASVFVRGTNSDQVLVLRDGMPLNDASDSSGAFNFGIDTLADVERIEVIRGPMAALYGSGAIGGVINLISRRGHEAGLHVTGELAGGYPKQIEGNINASGVENNLDYSATFEGHSSQGFDTTPRRESIYTATRQGYRDNVGTLNLGYTIVPGTRVSVLLRARQAVFGYNALGNPTFDDANSTGRDAQLLGRGGIQSKMFDGQFETGLFIGRLQDDRQYTELLNPLDPNQASGDSRYHGYRTDVQWNNTVHLDRMIGSTILSGTDLTFGYEYTEDTVKVRVDSASFGFPYNSSAAAHMEANAGYAGLQTTLFNRLTLTGQIRQDAVLGDTPRTWRLGAVYDLLPGTKLKAAYGTAFRAPSLFDRYGVDSYGYVGNPALKPETAQGWEAGFVQTLALGGQPEGLRFSATYFNEQVQQLIVTEFTPVYTAVNIGSAHIQGVETALTLRPADWISVDLTYTFTQAQNADSGSALLRRPQNTASLDATITPIPRLRIVPELLFTGAFQDYLVDDGGNATSNIGTSGAGLIANLTVTYALMPQASLFITGRNLTNSQFEPVNGYATPGTSMLAGVRFKL